MVTPQKISGDEWRTKSRRGEVCGILGCKNQPIASCLHCGNSYCSEHLPLLGTPAHGLKKEVIDG